MQNNAAFFLGLRLAFAAGFVIVLLVGVYGAWHYQKIFGVDPAMPSENASARNYTKILVIAIWAHILLITGGFALTL